MEPRVTASDIIRRFEDGSRIVEALRGVSLTIDPGEWVSIVGPSGCGKSTLLNILSSIDRPDSGRLHVVGQNLVAMSENQLAQWRGRHVGIVFQFFQLMPTLTALENVMLPMDLAGRRNDRRTRGLALLDRVGVAHLANQLPSRLSGGEQQRVAIARALANDPKLLFADEPTGNLDSTNGQLVCELLRELWLDGLTLVMVTHDPAVSSYASREIQMADGAIVAPAMSGT